MANGNESEGKAGKSFSLNAVRKNPWILATVILAVVLVIALIAKSGSLTGNVVSSDAAAQKVLSFIAAQGSTADLVSTAKNGTLYQVIVNYQGNDIPVYVTLDGKYLVPGLVPLDVAASDTGAAASESGSTTKVVKSDKPVVELFVMALCPAGTQAEKGIIPVVNLLGSKIDFKIRYVSYAMHGKTEIDEDTRQYCIQKEQTSKFLTYMSCYLKDGGSDACLTSTGIDKTKLTSCVAATDKLFNITANFNDKASWVGGQFPKYDVDASANEEYGVQGSPTLVINGAQVSSARDSASLLKTICSAFTTAPAECGDTLSSTAPSPGFGYTASSGGSTTAGCATA